MTRFDRQLRRQKDKLVKKVVGEFAIPGGGTQQELVQRAAMKITQAWARIGERSIPVSLSLFHEPRCPYALTHQGPEIGSEARCNCKVVLVRSRRADS